ncbi:MAG: dTDP-4-dehydrorhamnose 3,5-epimerase [Geminicoccaceae bacterium]
MELVNTAIPDVKIIRPKKFGDHRGFFSEVYSKRSFEDAGLNFDFIQDNHSRSSQRGTIRGLHFQSPPFAQTKLVRVLHGAILDVAVDIRKGSPWYGQHVAVELTDEAWNQLLVPRGFAHGFMTLTEDTEVFYKVDADYSPAHDKGVMWNDPDIGIDWPLDGIEAVLSDKDTRQPSFASLEDFFVYSGANSRQTVDN